MTGDEFGVLIVVVASLIVIAWLVIDDKLRVKRNEAYLRSLISLVPTWGELEKAQELVARSRRVQAEARQKMIDEINNAPILVYVHFKGRDPWNLGHVEKTVEVAEGVLIDYAKDGSMIGVEVIDALHVSYDSGFTKPQG